MESGEVTTFLWKKAELALDSLDTEQSVLFVAKNKNHPVFPGREDNNKKNNVSKVNHQRREGDVKGKHQNDVMSKKKFKRNFEEEEKEMESILEEDAEDEETQIDEGEPKSKRRNNPEDRNRRTVFVGNIPKKYSGVQIKQLFKDCGRIETVRIRSVAPARDDLPIAVIGKTKDYHPNRSSFNAYIVFESEKSVTEALKRNGELLGGNHLRIDTTTKKKQLYANKKSVFVGNLPFEMEEDKLRDFMADCGEIEAVRLIRDKRTGLGKGCGFVMFQDPASAFLALKLDASKFEGRKIRVSQATNQQKQKESKQASKTDRPKPGNPVDIKQPNKKMKMKKKHKKKNKADNVQTIALPVKQTEIQENNIPFPRTKLTGVKTSLKHPQKRTFSAPSTKNFNSVNFTGKKVKFDD